MKIFDRDTSRMDPRYTPPGLYLMRWVWLNVLGRNPL